jgi:hypothetical protein
VPRRGGGRSGATAGVRSVVGPVDILVIKPDNAFWVKYKELEA